MQSLSNHLTPCIGLALGVLEQEAALECVLSCRLTQLLVHDQH